MVAAITSVIVRGGIAGQKGNISISIIVIQ